MRSTATVLRKLLGGRWLLAAAIVPAVAGGVAAAAIPHSAGQANRRSEPASTAKLRHRLPAPRLVGPGNGGTYQEMPAFAWSAVHGAAKYEFQLAADRGFSSTLFTVQTLNTFATVDKSLTDGTYYWRVRSINSGKVAGLWATPHSFSKRWTAAPVPLSPPSGSAIVYPNTPLVLHWSAVPHAFKYLVYIATDPSLGSLAPSFGSKPVETSGTSFALPGALAPGRYYWGVTPEDSGKHTGAPSSVSSFDWSWPTGSATSVRDASGMQATDGSGLPEVLSPVLSWDLVPGAAHYEVEINPSSDFAPGSKVCCSDNPTGTSLSPVHYLPNNVYYWRVRAVDINGNAGAWNLGPSFRKAFDDQTPSIGDLTLRDPGTANASALAVGSTTSAPLITWDPVAGASKYEVDITPYNSGVLNDCDWSLKQSFFTATTAWTPLASRSARPQPTGWPAISSDGFKHLTAGTYCARVIAISDRDQSSKDVISVPTPLGGPGQPGFTYAPSSVPGDPGLEFVQSSDYLSMRSGSSTGTMPVFRWNPIAGAQSYYVVVAKDSAFTKIIDAAITNVPAYAPRTGSTSVRTYTDETTQYYWQVLPAVDVDGTTCHCDLTTNNPQSFNKQSQPPGLLSPGPGAVVSQQPTFAWTPADGARNFELQVAQDPSFANPIDDVKTDSVSYTSSSTYPADTTLYWRVRANNENNEGLNWSQSGTFIRTLASPALSSANPALGSDVPVVRWSTVAGATSYTVHVEQGDGTTRDFTMSSSAFTPTGFVGVGNLRWQVRANFPKSGFGETPGPFSTLQTFTRQIDPPTGVHWTYGRHHVLLSWDPSANIGTKQYRVQISTTNSFSSLIDTHTTANTSYAPLLSASAFEKASTLYWRVATVDERGTLGAWTSRTLTLGGRMKIRVSGRLRHRHRGTVRVKLTNSHGRAIRGGKVRVTGVGFRAIAKRTSRHGTVTFRLRPMRKGKLRFQGSKSGYQSVSRALRVR